MVAKWSTAVRKVPAGSVALEPVESEGACGCRIQELITAREGAPTFAMRRFTVDAGGHTAFHRHAWEHEVYVLGGHGTLKLDGHAVDLQVGDAALVLPDELHSFECSGEEPLVFLCMIPVQQPCCR